MAPGPLRTVFVTFFFRKNGVQKSALFSDPSRTAIFSVLAPKMDPKSMLFWCQNRFRVKFADFSRTCRIYRPCHVFLTIFTWRNHQKTPKIDKNPMKKRSSEKSTSESRFFTFFGRFWVPLGAPDLSPGRPKNVKGGSRECIFKKNRKFLATFFA